MKISFNWLKEYIDFSYSPQELADTLTMLGLEVATVEKIGGPANDLDGVVVGHVQTAQPHPNADRLRVCLVDVGEAEPLHIVCGASNVAAGQKVAVARVGTTLYPFKGDPIKLKKSKIRGELSMGMICAEDELGLGPDHDGILVLDERWAAGTPFVDTLNIDEDYVIEIELTPNRVDAASHYGVARDLAAFLRTRPSLPEISLKKADLKRPHPVPVTIQDGDKCKRYTSIYIEGVKVGDSPEWMQKRLKAIGLRPINNIVDITNYVMMELGQPMHAFDAEELRGQQVIVKTMETPTAFLTLDEVERQLVPGEDLMICDAERPLCIGGVMGGLNSGVTAKTRNVFLEVAYFDPGAVRKTRSRMDLHTDSSYRNERGTDPFMIETAALRAASLMVALAGGKASQIQTVDTSTFPPFEIDFSLKRARVLYGKDIPREEQLDILQALEIEVEEDPDGDTLHLRVPPFRVDVTRPQDVMEEILRIHGYNSVEIPEAVNMSLNFRQYKDVFRLRHRYADFLSANGFYEIMNNSLVPAGLGNENAVHMLNPLSEDLGILRQSMLPGMLESIRYNQNRQIDNLAFYEFGKTYSRRDDTFEERSWLAMVISGQDHEPHWARQPHDTTLYTLTREVERMCAWFHLSGESEEIHEAPFAYGIRFMADGKPLLRYGKVDPERTDPYGIRNDVFYLEADWDLLSESYFASDITFSPIPQFPAMRRDISLLIDETISFAQLKAVVVQAQPKLIRKVALHDVYQGQGIPTGKKSYLISIELRDDAQTLEDKAADKIMQRAYQLLKKEVEAEIRGNDQV